MPNKEELFKKIRELKAEIADLEYKRMRSTSALVESMLDKKQPDETEEKFFRTLSKMIEMKRKALRMLQEEADQTKDGSVE